METAYTWIYSRNILQILFALPVPGWTGSPPAAAVSLPQRLALICPGRTCCWNLWVVSFLLITPTFLHQMYPRTNILPFVWKTLILGPTSCFLGCLRDLPYSGKFCRDTEAPLGTAPWALHVAGSTSSKVWKQLSFGVKAVLWGSKALVLRPLCCCRNGVWWWWGQAGHWAVPGGEELCLETKISAPYLWYAGDVQLSQERGEISWGQSYISAVIGTPSSSLNQANALSLDDPSLPFLRSSFSLLIFLKY